MNTVLLRKPEFFEGAQLKVGIIGCGYVGLPLALRFAEADHKVTGFDTDPKKLGCSTTVALTSTMFLKTKSSSSS